MLSILLSSVCNLFKYIALQIYLEGIMILDYNLYRTPIGITGSIQWETSVCNIYSVDKRGGNFDPDAVQNCGNAKLLISSYSSIRNARIIYLEVKTPLAHLSLSSGEYKSKFWMH